LLLSFGIQFNSVTQQNWSNKNSLIKSHVGLKLKNWNF